MRRTFSIFAVVVIASASTALAQTQQGAWEFSVSGSFASLSSKTESSGYGGSHTHESDAENYFSLLLRPGFFIIEGLEIEPEIYWGAASGVPPSFSVSGNLSYNLTIPGSRVTPFALAGYGIGNGVPILETLVSRSSDEFNIGVLNLGGGLKIFVTKQVAFRAEYRFQQYSQETTSGSGSFTTTTNRTYTFHNAFLGVSVFVQ